MDERSTVLSLPLSLTYSGVWRQLFDVVFNSVNWPFLALKFYLMRDRDMKSRSCSRHAAANTNHGAIDCRAERWM